jgi:hypothetical protein
MANTDYRLISYLLRGLHALVMLLSIHTRWVHACIQPVVRGRPANTKQAKFPFFQSSLSFLLQTPQNQQRMADTMPTSVVVCGLPEAGRLHVQQRDGEAATLHDVYATGSLLCALPAQPDEELVAQLPLLVSARADPSNHSLPSGSRVCHACCDSACPMA